MLISVIGIISGLVVLGGLMAAARLSLVVLAGCLAARYWMKLARGWRTTYVITAVVAIYWAALRGFRVAR